MRSVRLLRNDVFRAFKPFWNKTYPCQKYANATVEPEKGVAKDPYEGNYSFTECDQYTKITLIGAAGRVGRTLSLLLKTCPLVDHLCLFDVDRSVKGIGVDISHIDTKCTVSYVCGMKNIHKALDAPDVVVIAAGCPASPQLNGKKLFDKNAPLVAGLSEACARFCPKACVVLITNPINSLVPVMVEVYQMITNKLPSRKMFGLTTLDVVRANTFVAEVVRKDPNSIIVPVVGGTSQETIVPVISQMKPCCKIKRNEAMALTECLKRAEGNLADCQNCGTPGASSLSTAYAAFRFTSSLVMALKGAQDIIECAYVKSDIIPELEYLASPLKLGIRGIEHNFGYPQLSETENLDLTLGRLEDLTTKSMPKEEKVWTKYLPKLNVETRNGGFVSRTAQGCTAGRGTGMCHRMYHTGNSEMFLYRDSAQRKNASVQSETQSEKYKRYINEDRKKTAPIKALNILKYKTRNIQKATRQPPWEVKVERTHYKLLNASAKQKFRTFNVQRKYTPPNSPLLLTVEKDRRDRLEKNCGLPVRQEPEKTEEASTSDDSKMSETEDEDGAETVRSLVTEEEKNKDLMVPKKEKDEMERYKEFILKQLLDLKRENEELKKRLLKIMENKKLETALQAQTDSLELERTKLKACWLVMSSTMDAFSNFCKKFTSKSDPSKLPTVKTRAEEEEEFEDAVDTRDPDKKEETYDDKYYNFLNKLMQDQVEEEKIRNRVQVGK